MGSKAEYKDATDRLYGRMKFTVSTGSVEGLAAAGGRRRFSNCVVESVPQPKGRKPHMVVRNGKGDVLFEVGARQTTSYANLRSLEGWKLSSFSWTERDSYAPGETYLLCKATTAKPHTVVDDPIPRIVLDSETTGLHPAWDEILQLSIIDGNGTTLLNRLYKPDNTDSWPEAERVHRISPRKVAACPSIMDDFDMIQSILDRALEVCVYNAEFDLAFLGNLGFRLDEAKVRDTMEEYGRKYHDTKYYKLEKAAAECGYRYKAHDALEDCRATLKVQNRVDGLTQSQIDRMKEVAESAELYDSAHLGTPQSDMRASSDIPPKTRKPMSKAGYVLFNILLWILILLDAILIVTCFAAPFLLIIAIPAVLITIPLFRSRKRLKPDARAKHRGSGRISRPRSARWRPIP